MNNTFTNQRNELEKNILATFINYKNSIKKYISITEEIFSSETHKNIFRILKQLTEEDTTIDLITINNHAIKKGINIDIAYVAGLTRLFTTSTNIDIYIKLLTEYYIKDKLKELSYKTISKASDEASDCFNILQEVNEDMNKIHSLISQHVPVNSTKTLAHYMLNYTNSKMIEAKSSPVSVPTMHEEVDAKLFGGYKKGNLIVVAGRPSMGKTFIALSNILRIAERKMKPVLFSLEMTKEEIWYRMIKSVSSINPAKLNSFNMSEEDLKEYMKATEKLYEYDIYIDDTSAVDTNYIYSVLYKLVSEKMCDVAFIDYLGLMKMPKAQNREREISITTSTLKNIAKNLNIPIVLLSQLNRKCEERADKRPIMSDLKDSGSIEADADIIMFLYRDNYYNKDNEEKSIEINIAKNRNGIAGETVKVYYDDTFSKIINPIEKMF